MQNTSPMQQQQQQQSQSNWPMHMGFNQNSNDGGFPHHPNNLPQQQQQHKSTGKRSKRSATIYLEKDSSAGFGNNFSDWIDPAIVSFRQYPQFNPQQQQQAQNQANNDMYMSQINQQGKWLAFV